MATARRKAASVKVSRAEVLLAGALRAWRKERQLCLKQVAAGLGVSISTLEGWETGHRFPTGRHLTNLSDYTGIPVCRLFCLGANDCPLPWTAAHLPVAQPKAT